MLRERTCSAWGMREPYSARKLSIVEALLLGSAVNGKMGEFTEAEKESHN